MDRVALNVYAGEDKACFHLMDAFPDFECRVMNPCFIPGNNTMEEIRLLKYDNLSKA
jgi:hypothetical protein